MHIDRMYTTRGQLVTPNPVQWWILEAFRSSRVFDILVSGGLGGGKTAVGAQALVETAAQNANITDGAPLRYGIVSPSFSQLNRVTLEAFRGVWNAMNDQKGSSPQAFSACDSVIRWDKKECIIYTKLGAEFVYGTGDNAARALEGSELTAAWVDEPALCKEETQARIRERFRQNVFGPTGATIQGIISTGTPRPGWSLAWLHKTFGNLDDYTPNGLRKCRVALPTRLNLPNLRPGYLDELRSMYSPRMMEAMLEGKFVVLTGAVYPDWGEGSAVDYIHDPKREVIIGLDPGYRRAAWICTQPTHAYQAGLPLIGTEGWTIFDEIITADTDTERQTLQLLQKPWMKGRTTITIAHDPAGVAKQSAVGKSDMDIIKDTCRKAGVNVVFSCSRKPEDHAIQARCERLRALIKSADGVQKMTIARPMQRRQYTPGEDGRKSVGIYESLLEQPFKDGKDIPDDSTVWKPWTHSGDALGYLAVFVAPIFAHDDQGWKDAAEEGYEERALGGEMGDFGGDGFGVADF
ncbi:hypothetical protein HN371_29410 [Candidatus Poribacteria bacterium]|jgi:hypothetical protein|nr:hypothetical protein [Candidatus Poribacteria bacterium]MBT7096595.1 hypothetical protein [Candidatus Poribacteria bacterium]